MADGAPQIHDDAPKNIEHENRITGGEPDAVFARAQRVVRQRMLSQRLCGVPMEGRATLAAPDPATGGLTMWATTQAPHGFRNELAGALGLAQNLVRVIAPEVGGGFGVKFGIYPEDATLAVIALRLRRPVRWVETRTEHMLATTHGRDQVADLEAAVDADGTIIALRMHVIANVGAYPIFTFIPDLTLFMGVGVYRIPNVDLRSTCVFTNTTPVAAYRGAGRPEAAYYVERMIDCVAAELGQAPEAVRRRNFIPPDAVPYPAPTRQPQPRRRRHRDTQRVAEGAGQGQAHRRPFDGSGAGGHRRRRRRLSRARRAGPRRHARPDRSQGLRRRFAARDRQRPRGDGLLQPAPARLPVRRSHCRRRSGPRDWPRAPARFRLGRRLRRPHQPDDRRWPGARRPRPGHRTGARRTSRAR